MNAKERIFWVAVRRALMGFVVAIEEYVGITVDESVAKRRASFDRLLR